MALNRQQSKATVLAHRPTNSPTARPAVAAAGPVNACAVADIVEHCASAFARCRSTCRPLPPQRQPAQGVCGLVASRIQYCFSNISLRALSVLYTNLGFVLIITRAMHYVVACGAAGTWAVLAGRTG